MNVFPISEERFRWLTQAPVPVGLFQELAWFTDRSERVMGALFRDMVDEEFGYVVWARSTPPAFEAETFEIDYVDFSSAQQELEVAITRLAFSKQALVPSRLSPGRGIDLFTLAVAAEKLHPNFRYLCESRDCADAREALKVLATYFSDIDGNFVKDFQSAGFDSRLWEIYLFACCLEEGLDRNLTHNRPDFLISRGSQRAAIEAAIIGEPVKRQPSVDHPMVGDLPGAAPPELRSALRERVAIRYSSSLTKKLKNRYWELKHVRGMPLVLALADFHEPMCQLWTHSILREYLYGECVTVIPDQDGNVTVEQQLIEGYTKASGARVEANFFALPEARHISAVLSSNHATLSKFSRMGRLSGFGLSESSKKVVRTGTCFDASPGAKMHGIFGYEVHPGLVTETWTEGLVMYHNPRAEHPFPPELLPSIAHYFPAIGSRPPQARFPTFFPFVSITRHLIPTSQDVGAI